MENPPKKRQTTGPAMLTWKEGKGHQKISLGRSGRTELHLFFRGPGVSEERADHDGQGRVKRLEAHLQR